MIKILFLIPTLGPGGAERVLVNLINNLDRTKFDITLQTVFDEGINKNYLSDGITYKSFWRHQFRGNSHLMKLFSPEFLYKRIVKQKYDIIVGYLEGPVVRILSGCPFKGTKRIAWFHTAPQTDRVFSVGFLGKKQAIKAYASMDKIVCVSKGVADALKCITGDSLNNLEVKYNTIDSERIQQLAMIEPDNSHFDFSGIKVCAVGKIQNVKGFDRLAQVHKLLKTEGLAHRVYIIGAGEQELELKQYIEENDLSDSFVLLGFQDNPYQYMANCDLYVCSSRREGFSSTVAEALILGKPVISTDVSGARELLGNNNEYGIVVENSVNGIYEGMKKMLESNELRHCYAEKALGRGACFSIMKTVADVEGMLLELYDK